MGSKTFKSIVLGHLPDRALQRLKKYHYERKLRHAGANEEHDLSVVSRLVAPGECAIDVGANFGVYTKALSERVGPTGKVYSFEPIPQTFDILASNVQRLGLSNVKMVNAAVSNETGLAMMEIPKYQSGGENFYQARITEGPGRPALRHVEIHTVPLDELTTRVWRLSFIKLDVEGHEWPCIQGARGIIEAFNPSLLIEVSTNPDDPTTSAFELFSYLKAEGYEPHLLDGDILRHRRPGDHAVNYFFLRQEHLKRAFGNLEVWHDRDSA